ncbi:ComF family protein [Saccharibacillus alkalitolerans]|uniref:ComF family protein n=1 Tax=Saccharibacillus alkalitolerans TaxID=2705290 RepID=A0ABX0F809_9BACL|nr:ComF family protein [Saccharibacillus alkalitolerans]NGZ76129.1 ComF family protein [Saccharibacillus alkalitolerans]
MRGGAERALSVLRRLLAPNFEPCLACGKPVRAGASLPGICERCAAGVPWIARPRCPVCGRAQGCPDCLRPEARERAFEMNRSAVLYDAAMRRWIAEYKYGGREAFAEPFSIMLEQAYRNLVREMSAERKIRYRSPGWKADLVTWVPVSEERLEERGFNQAELIARQMARRLHIPAHALLERRVHTGKQSSKTRAERLHNLDGAFGLLPNLDPRFFRKWDLIGTEKRPRGSFPIAILLVDDIYTTGTTAAICASALKQLESLLGCSVLVYSLTLARS